VWEEHGGGGVFDGGTGVNTLAQLASLLRALRRRHGRERGDTPLTYRELAAKTGWAHGIIGDYFSGKRLPPTDRFDALVRLLGATLAEQGVFATARDRVEENRRRDQRNRLPTVTPWELPRDVTMFTGREVQLAELDLRLSLPNPAAVTVVSGGPGVGKTALAVHWAHRVAGRFFDGCLYVDLGGRGQPVRPDRALSGFLRSLGRTGEDAAEPELAARYRSLLAGRRMLVLLDDAHSAEQVRPLLPGGRTCFVLVTSRDKLSGLVARDGADRIELDRLTGAEAGMLFRNLVGARAIAEPRAVARLADQCARLPLAVRVAAEVAVSRPHASLSTLADELRTGSA
jgi:transcriptional regulator with XRE-family HTH domain